MFRFFTIFFLAIGLSACATSDLTLKKQLEDLQLEVATQKNNQVIIARRVGLGELVRPNNIEFGQGEKVGNENAEIAIIEFTDLHCPFCLRFHTDVYPQLKQQFIDSGKVLFVGRELPLLSLHQQAGFAAVALRCAAQQQQYGPAKDKLFNGVNSFTPEFIEQMPIDLGIDTNKFESCLQDGAVHKAVSESITYAGELGFKSTPTFIIGRKQGNTVVDYTILSGAKDLTAFTDVINTLLQQK